MQNMQHYSFVYFNFIFFLNANRKMSDGELMVASIPWLYL